MRLYDTELVQYGVFDSRVKFPKIIYTEERTVACYEFELFTEDQTGICYIDDRAIPLKKGTLICAKPGQKRRSKLHFRCINMHLRIIDPSLTEILDQLPDTSTLLDISEVISIFHRILGLDLHNFPEQKCLLYSYVFEFLHHIISELRATGSTGSQYTHRATILEAQKYIREHLDEDLSLQALATKANLSAVYFHKLFSTHAGMSPAAFVLHCRIAAAKALLKAGELALSDIASRCGFTSQSYFNYKFKEVAGETPLQYRKTRLSRMKL